MEMIVAQLSEVTAQQDREIEWLAELLGAYCLYEKKQYGDISFVHILSVFRKAKVIIYFNSRKSTIKGRWSL